MRINSIRYIYNKLEQDSFYDVFEKELVIDNSKSIFSFINPYSSIQLLKNINLVEEINHLFVDGALQVYFANCFFKKNIKRYSFDFSSIADFVFEKISNKNLKLAIIGGSNEDLQHFKENVKIRHSTLDLNNIYSGFFEDKIELINRLKNIDADVLLIGMGTPLQEEACLLAKKYSKRANIIVTCGGFITQTAKKTDYYHPLIKKTGLRWLQRAFMESHYRKRLIIEYPKFIWLSFKSYFNKYD